MDEVTKINWDRPMLDRFKAALHKADDELRQKAIKGVYVGTGEDVFEFDGRQFVVGYAKYLVEYLETKLSR